jgi:hypothetical protein
MGEGTDVAGPHGVLTPANTSRIGIGMALRRATGMPYFSWFKHTKTGKMQQNDHKLYQMSTRI